MRKNKGILSQLESTNFIPKPNEIFVGRVRYCLLDDKTKPNIFEKFDGWSSIGGVFFNNIEHPNPSEDFTKDNFALPLYPNNKVYPLENELIYIISLSNNSSHTADLSVSNNSYYYFQPINLWNSSHHNASPDPLSKSEFKLGDTFKEKSNIKNLQPFEGDIIYEGRWGQSIRLGSTTKKSKVVNNWSSNGEDGDPITIIRNEQRVETNKSLNYQIEDINEDPSSIYITSSQILPIRVSSSNYDSYNNQPISPNQYGGRQIIFNSDRLLFNSKRDSILFSAFKSINLNSLESVNIDTKETILNSKKILLGSKQATEPLILGDKFLDDLQQLLTQLIALSTSLQSPIGTPTPYVPNITITSPAVQTSEMAKKMLKNIQNYKSKVSKTK